MKIAVFSDSHGNIDNMRRAVEDYGPQVLIFLGDGCRDAEKLHSEYPELAFHYVKGNCDFSYTPPDTDLFECGGIRFFIAHGHKHNVKLGMMPFLNSCHFSGAQIGLFGHTHCPKITKYEELTVMNPGSCGCGAFPTYGQISIQNGKFECHIAEIPQ